jgi:hypothetical protein
MELVGGDDPELRVANLPPPLVPDDRDLERVRRLSAPLDRVDIACGHEEQHDDDEERYHRPGLFDLAAAVHLWRLAPVVAPPSPEADEGVDSQASNDEEDDGGDAEHDQGHFTDGERRRRDRREDARGHQATSRWDD